MKRCQYRNRENGVFICSLGLSIEKCSTCDSFKPFRLENANIPSVESVAPSRAGYSVEVRKSSASNSPAVSSVPLTSGCGCKKKAPVTS